ncbi:MAG: hypothetical protein SFU53_15470 [Terrimicrobiaceae bacterium]|nr:hypothetical protein [Terrimicrobiaceae bacterium]
MAAVSAFLMTAGSAVAGNPLLKGDTLRQVTVASATDGIPSGWCGRAMLSLLQRTGLGKGLKPGNGQDWEKILADAGWRPVNVSSPGKAPLGSVLVYTSDRRLGRVPRGTPGSYYGHVEMVALSPQGGRMYVADSPRPRPGGSVPDNFTGRAWVPPGSTRPRVITVDIDIDTIMSERLKMALDHFDRAAGQRAALTTTDPAIRVR